MFVNKIIDLLGLSEFKEKIISLIPTKVSQLDNDSEYATKKSVEDLKKSVSDGKELVAGAITEKGVTTAADAEFATMAENICQIETGSDVKLQERTIDSFVAGNRPLSMILEPQEGFDGMSKVILNGIITQEKVVDPSNAGFYVRPDDGKILSSVYVRAVNNQAKTAVLSTSAQTIKPDSGYNGLSQVGVPAIQLQEKTINPSTTAQTVTPDSGKNGLSKVTVNAMKLQSKTVTPSTANQVILPDSGYNGLSQVSVSATATPSSVTITGTNKVTVSCTGKTSKSASKNYTITCDIPLSETKTIVSNTASNGGSNLSGNFTYAASTSTTITGISFDSASSISMISEHMGVDLETAQQMYNVKNVLFEFEEDELENNRAQKISEVIINSEKLITQSEKLVADNE